jgi:ribonuclease P/MRP protein subunit POP5
MTVRPPTIRDKRRYVLARILPAGTTPGQKELYYAVLEAATTLWGDVMTSLAQPAVVAVEQGHAVVRCRRGMERECAIALSMVTSCDGRPVALRVIAISGTIESLRERICNHPAEVPPSSPPRECRLKERDCTVTRCEGQKVDVIEKGFKNAARFYLTTEDMEEH